MREFHTSKVVNASCDQVWSVLADVKRWPEWTESVSKVELLDRSSLMIGSRVRIYQPKLRPAVWTITEWQPARKFTWVAKHPGLLMVADHALAPNSTGCTITLTFTLKGLLSGLAGFLNGSLINQYVELEAAGLKARSERPK